MRMRTRTLSGVATLLALALSLFGGVWASAVCWPAMDMGAEATQHGAMAGHDGMPAPAGHRHDAPTRAPECPFGASAVTGSCMAASLPASAALQLAPSLEGALTFAATPTEPHLLLGTGLFRPPRA